MKLLVVDDDDFILELLPMVLALFGYEDVSASATPLDALALVRHEQPGFDCLLLDIQMPGMDGIELCRQIRALRGYADTPIIMLTAMSDKDSIDQAFAAGATDYITKPFDVTEIGARVRVAAKLKEAQDALQVVHQNHEKAVQNSRLPDKAQVTRKEISELFAGELGYRGKSSTG
ncbi:MULTISPECIES: response regulator [Actibacterium]|uniref:DNA-binding response OmpR family regulator n=1 Tax=Actibacterium naphthalenivorans TaxID=1614693 RepID=A0A840CFJ9_9RHOB|nr:MULTISPECIES: response regulator [Actibacterium]MBB4021546.1 DNA-binding response OmpR family regulator [Actibacterium naphthalenivorans]